MAEPVKLESPETVRKASPDEQDTAVTTWDDAQCESGLAHLERLQDQLDALRTAIPSLLRPLTTPSDNRAEALVRLQKAAIGLRDDLASFREAFTSGSTTQLLERSRDSLATNSDLTKAANVAAYGWDRS